MIRREGERMMVSGRVTLATVGSLLESGLDQVRDGVRVVDLAEVAELDSSLIAAVLAWLREARLLNRSLELANPPQGFSTLAQLYGIGDLLPAAERQPR
ncbi:MAG: STAS domain-containing protein [Betaproteobacteria bacterium]|nr:STAS domain-containing protein [Betaproteobacteria bacterium]